MIAVGFALLGQNAFRGGVGGSSGCTFGTISYPFRGVKLVGVCVVVKVHQAVTGTKCTLPCWSHNVLFHFGYSSLVTTDIHPVWSKGMQINSAYTYTLKDFLSI